MWVDAVPVDVTERSVGVVPDEPADGTALVMYTSGTTGAPKGAVLSRGAVAAGLDGLRDAWAWTPDDVLVHGLPLFHVHGLVLGVLGALRAGSPLVHTGRPTPAGLRGRGRHALLRRADRVGPGGGRAGRGARAGPGPAAGLRQRRAAGPGVFRDLQALAGQGPVERYGMTETLITLAARADGERRPGWVGSPIAGVEARIVDDAGGPRAGRRRSATCRCAGRRCSTATSAAAGRRSTADGWFAPATPRWSTRPGSTASSAAPATTSSRAAATAWAPARSRPCCWTTRRVAEVAVVGRAGRRPGPAHRRLRGRGRRCRDVDGAGLIDHVAAQLSRHKRPREVRFVDALPRNAMGKIQKARLR